MPKPKRAKIEKETMFQRCAGWARNISTIAIIIFMVCYILGAFFRCGTSAIGYLKVGFVNALLLTIIMAFFKFFRRKRSKESILKIYTELLFCFAVFFTAGIAEYFVINHESLYWIIFVILVSALSLSIIEFAIQLKTMWHGTILSREKTLIQFIYLYATTVFSFTFLYTILYTILNNPPNYILFDITNPTNTFFDFLYLSIITVSTLGYGDIIPHSALAKFLVMLQTIIGYLFLYIFLGLVVSWLGKREK